MARLPDVDLTRNPDIAEVFARVEKSRGWVSNLMRAITHSPAEERHGDDEVALQPLDYSMGVVTWR